MRYYATLQYAMPLMTCLSTKTNTPTDLMEGMEMATGHTPSRKDVKVAEERRISQIGDFKSRIGGLLDLPSGVTVRVHNPGGMQVFMDSKAIPNSLMPIIQNALKTGKMLEAKELLGENDTLDPAMLQDMSDLMDNVVMKTIVEPRVSPNLTQSDIDDWNHDHPDERVEGIEELRDELDNIQPKLYVDEFPLEDKQFVFQWVAGGTRDLEEFLRQQREDVGAVSAVLGDTATTK